MAPLGPLSWLPLAMTPFARLRRCATQTLGGVLLAWFALTLAAATAAPINFPVTLLGICTSTAAAGLGQDGAPAASHHLNCPLCVSVVPPPPPQGKLDAAPLALSYLLRPSASAQVHAHPTTTPQARAPPSA